ncbi:hypothetical protein BTJ45_03777 [Bacillus mycoides]|nr:hypothetical protein BTJ45_03777 [Bacillus mycoides]
MASHLPTRQKAPLRRKLHPPLILNEPLALLVVIQLQRLESPVASHLPTRQKAPLRQKLHPPAILNEPLALLKWPY